ncbi:hypothetical protein [Novosphingobium clariflavum]|uniref:Uncharacterized protein n=1 Tax=Novosphingobium clariflavum TaxID=2029884 RepID=A0ABV6SE44_9SPHN|nr:hypothetical protein [Novosphingobium clariflavum]
MTPEIAGMRIARTIRSVENDMDELLAKSSELFAEIARARIVTEEAARLGQQPMARVARLQQSLMDARLELVRAHRDLSKIAETMDIPIRCPDEARLAEMTAEEIGAMVATAA